MQTFYLKKTNDGKFTTEDSSLSMKEVKETVSNDEGIDDISIIYLPSLDKILYRSNFRYEEKNSKDETVPIFVSSYVARCIYDYHDTKIDCVRFYVDKMFFLKYIKLYENTFNVKITYISDNERTVTFYSLNTDEFKTTNAIIC